MRKPRCCSSPAACTGVRPPSTMSAKQGHALCKARAGGVHRLRRAQRLDEQRVDAALAVALGALEGRVQIFHAQRGGARQGQGPGAGTGVQRGAPLAAHLSHRHHVLAFEVAASLRQALILQPTHRGADALESAHRALHVQHIAEAVVGVDDYRQLYALGAACQRAGNFAECRQADLRPSQPRVGDGRAAEVQRPEKPACAASSADSASCTPGASSRGSARRAARVIVLPTARRRYAPR